MSLPWSTAGASRTVTYAAIADADGIKQSIATSIAAQNYSGVALNGARAAGWPTWLPQTVSVTSSASAVTYNTTDPIVFTGTDCDGAVVTESLYLTQAGGNETIVGTVAFAGYTSIAVPAQLTALGAFTFGMRDIKFPRKRELARAIRAAGAGNVYVGYDGSLTDTMPMVVGQIEPVLARIIYGTAATTALPLVVYL